MLKHNVYPFLQKNLKFEKKISIEVLKDPFILTFFMFNKFPLFYVYFGILAVHSVLFQVPTVQMPPLPLRYVIGFMSHLARKDVAKDRESVIERLVVNGFVQVLNKDISNTRFTKGRVSLRPHQSHGTTFDQFIVHCIQGTFGWNVFQLSVVYNGGYKIKIF